MRKLHLDVELRRAETKWYILTMNNAPNKASEATPPPTLLRTLESPDEHAFAAVDRYRSDIALLNYLLQDLRVLVRRYAKGELALSKHQKIVWEVHGLQRRTVVCNPKRLLEDTSVQFVGFFGDRRETVDEVVLNANEQALLDGFVNYPGILSYSSCELVNGYRANLVVHSEPDDREAWRGSHIHKDAVATIAPAPYHNVRIHNGVIAAGVVGSDTVVIGSTKYWDYDTDPVWHATRRLPGGQSESMVGPVGDI